MRGYRRPSGAPHQRRSIPSFPEAAAPQPFEGEFWRSTFVEDISLGILPYESSNTAYTVRLDSESNAESAVAQIFPTRDNGYRTSLKVKIADFIEETARYLANGADIWFEILRSAPTQPPQEPPFVIKHIPRGLLTRLPWSLIQHVPRKARSRVGKRFITIPMRDIWHLALPPTLGTPRQHRSLLRFLGRNPFPPPFAVEAVAPGKDSRGYDFTLHRQAHQGSIAYATRRWGWTGRGMWAEDSSEYFTFHRSLRFRRAQILLRDHIIETMNTLLRREGIGAAIVIEGLTTASAVDSMLNRLKQGTATYTDALEILKE